MATATDLMTPEVPTGDDDSRLEIRATRWRRCSMPMYDYKCLDCGKESLVVLTLKEHETGIAKCPACNSTNTKQLYTSFIAHTTKKS
jgi:putative FmdB family regulatory protein